MRKDAMLVIIFKYKQYSRHNSLLKDYNIPLLVNTSNCTKTECRQIIFYIIAVIIIGKNVHVYTTGYIRKDLLFSKYISEADLGS